MTSPDAGFTEKFPTLTAGLTGIILPIYPRSLFFVKMPVLFVLPAPLVQVFLVLSQIQRHFFLSLCRRFVLRVCERENTPPTATPFSFFLSFFLSPQKKESDAVHLFSCCCYGDCN
jgi:hypothetical protein